MDCFGIESRAAISQQFETLRENVIDLQFDIALESVKGEIRKMIAPDFEALRRRRAAVADPGYWGGDRCNRNGCDGEIELDPVVDCSCHIDPPCGACVDRLARCPVCDWRSDEEEAAHV
jgi:hypothetical protein